MLSKGLVLDIDFTEKSGTVAGDSSRYGNDGALTGCKWIEHGLEFNGTSDYVDCGNDASLDITDVITLSAWIKSTDNGFVQRILDRDDGVNRDWILRLVGNGVPYIYIWQSNVIKSSGGIQDLNDDTWHHVVGVYDGDALRVYVDGTAEGTPTTGIPGGIDTDPQEVSVGISGSGTEGFNGSIGDVRIHNRALNTSEIKAYYDSAKHRYR